MPEFALAELAERIDARLVGDGGVRISGIAPLDAAGPADISHLSSTAWRPRLAGTRAAAVILRAVDIALCPVPALVCDNPYWGFARLSQLFERSVPLAGIDARAAVADDADLGPGTAIGPGAVVGAGARLGAGCRIHANAVIGADCVLGDGVELHPGAVLCDGAQLGDRCTIHANAVIGAEGFGYAPDGRGVLERIAQLGAVELGNDVSVGAGSTIDRGALANTRIGHGVKIDNQVQIGHNCVIGDHSVICGCCGIVGSTTIGRHCVLGGGVGVGGDGPLTLCDGVTVSGMTHVSRSIEQPGVYSGGVLHQRATRWKTQCPAFPGAGRTGAASEPFGSLARGGRGDGFRQITKTVPAAAPVGEAKPLASKRFSSSCRIATRSCW